MPGLGALPGDDDPFTGPLLGRWADEQYRRLDAATPDLDLWAAISRKLSR
ncbi:MAG: hypothetical protein H6807_03005 [Planctomycetes bacterium]|nr:hypothetical protein [Planctomycetota bacterium]